MDNLVEIKDNQVVVSSRNVAKAFGKEHKMVLRAIRDILAVQNCATKFYHETSFKSRGKEYPEYLMNKDGFSLLVMGFTGQDAMSWKIKYIEAFNAMENKLKVQAENQQQLLTNDSLGFKGPDIDTFELKDIVKVGLGRIPHTTNYIVAEKFGVPLIEVTKSIEAIIQTLGLDPYENRYFTRDVDSAVGRVYLMTQEGFSLAVMGFTSPMAIKWKEAFQREFSDRIEMCRGKELAKGRIFTNKERIGIALAEPRMNIAENADFNKLIAEIREDLKLFNRMFENIPRSMNTSSYEAWLYAVNHISASFTTRLFDLGDVKFEYIKD